jgi:hypothetical protein
MYEGLEDELYASADPYDSMPFGDLMRARDRELDEDADAERAEQDADEALGDAAHGEWRTDGLGIPYFAAFEDDDEPVLSTLDKRRLAHALVEEWATVRRATWALANEDGMDVAIDNIIRAFVPGYNAEEPPEATD